jgi:hypothetical protein
MLLDISCVPNMRWNELTGKIGDLEIAEFNKAH